MAQKYIFLLGFILVCRITFAQIPCENGKANGYDCNQIDFLAQLDNGELSGTAGVEGNDIWGWTDPTTAKEYVLMGQTNGTVFVDISNPLSPIIIGRLPSHTGNASIWRDIKVYKDHAFIVAENNSGHGMQVFDLTKLRGVSNPPQEFTEDANYDGVSSAHNVVINEDTGFAYIVGARNADNGCGGGGLHIVNIQDPKNPQYAGCFDADGYTHDAQCVTYQGPDQDYQGQEVCFNANENTVTIAKVGDKENTSLISKIGYPESSYSHQGWLTDDHQYFISNDELDEQNRGFNTRTLIWDVRNLDNPKLMTEFYSEKASIDHNLYVKDHMIFQSNYTSGLTVLDGSRIEQNNLRELAFFDTYPSNDGANFNGSWSNYPFFESGVIAISDINLGLFLVRLKLKNVIASHPVVEDSGSEIKISISVNEGFEVEKYQWQIVDNGKVTDILSNSNFTGFDTRELVINSSTAERLSELRFRCKVILADGSIATSFMSEKIQTDITLSNDDKEKQQFVIFPNPAKDLVSIRANEMQQINSFTIVNAAGKTIQEETFPPHSQYSLNVSQFKQGLYFVILTTQDGKRYLNKLMVNK